VSLSKNGPLLDGKAVGTMTALVLLGVTIGALVGWVFSR